MERNNLHDIDVRIQSITEGRVDPETGECFGDEFDQLALNALEALDLQRSDKVLHCAMYMQEHNLEVEKIKSVIIKLKKRMEQHKNQAAFLKRWVEESCRAGEEFECPEIKVTFRKSVRISIRDAEAIPIELMKIKTTQSLDKNEAKAWMKRHNGEAPPGIDAIPITNMQVK